MAQGLGHGQAAAIEGVALAHQLAGQVPPGFPPPIQQGEVVAAPILVPAGCQDEVSSSPDKVSCRREVCQLIEKAFPHDIPQSFTRVISVTGQCGNRLFGFPGRKESQNEGF